MEIVLVDCIFFFCVSAVQYGNGFCLIANFCVNAVQYGNGFWLMARFCMNTGAIAKCFVWWHKFIPTQALWESWLMAYFCKIPLFDWWHAFCKCNMVRLMGVQLMHMVNRWQSNGVGTYSPSTSDEQGSKSVCDDSLTPHSRTTTTTIIITCNTLTRVSYRNYPSHPCPSHYISTTPYTQGTTHH